MKNRNFINFLKICQDIKNDIIVGKCVFDGATLTGFDYTDRTLLNVQNIFLRVEPTEDAGMDVVGSMMDVVDKVVGSIVTDAVRYQRVYEVTG